MPETGKLNTLLIDDFNVVDGSGNPVTGLTFGPTDKELYNPSGTEVSGTITVTVTELGTGNYRVSFTPNALGDWVLILTHATYFPWGKRENYTIYTQNIDDITLTNLGIGNRTVEITVEDDVSSVGIPAVWVEVYDSSSTTRHAFGYTDSNGQITFQLFDGSYKVYLSKISQYVFTVPENLTVTASPPPPDVQVTYQGTAFDPGTPPSAGTCVVYGWEKDAQDVGLAVEVKAEIVGDDNFLRTHPHVVGTEITTTSDDTNDGYWSMPLIRSGQVASGGGIALYQFTIGDMVKTVEIPDQTTVALATLIDP